MSYLFRFLKGSFFYYLVSKYKRTRNAHLSIFWLLNEFASTHRSLVLCHVKNMQNLSSILAKRNDDNFIYAILFMIFCPLSNLKSMTPLLPAKSLFKSCCFNVWFGSGIGPGLVLSCLLLSDWCRAAFCKSD